MPSWLWSFLCGLQEPYTDRHLSRCPRGQALEWLLTTTEPQMSRNQPPTSEEDTP